VDVIAGLLRRQRPGLLRQPHQVQPLDVFHREEVDVAVEVEVERLDELGVLHLRDHLDLGAELIDHLEVGAELGVDDLEGDDLLEIEVEGLVDLAQAAFAEQVEEAVRPQLKRFVAVGEDVLGLEGGENAAADEQVGKGFGVGGPRQDGYLDLIDLSDA
jgi:hypothetical protein